MALSAQDLLNLWEQGITKGPVERALALLAAAGEKSLSSLEHQPIGWRDARLLELRESTFGPELTCIAQCPDCGQRAEVSFNTEDVFVGAPDGQWSEGFSFEIGGRGFELRLPNSTDLAAIAAAQDLVKARRLLLDRCIVSTPAAADLPDEVVAAIAEEMERRDPQADVQLSLSCPNCGHPWQAAFDIVSFFWTEIHTWAQRILRDVHTLASAYGWSERDVLAMSAWRRQAYLDIVSQWPTT
jgi:hypothetical protein